MRLIDADALAESLRESKDKLGKILSEERCEMEYRICEGQMVTFIEAILRVKEAHTIDAVTVVRCKDCKHFTEGMAIGICKRIEDKPIIPIPFNHYCSYGERRCDNE